MTSPTSSLRPAALYRLPQLRLPRQALSVAGALGFFGLWEFVGRAGVLGPSFPPLSAVAQEIWDHWAGLEPSFVASATRCAYGLSGGVAAAVSISSLLIWLPGLRGGVERMAIIINAFPVIALGPVLESTSLRAAGPAIFAGMAVFLSTFLTVADGLGAIDPARADVFSTYGATRLQVFVRLRVPAALPALLDACKMGVPAALLGALIGEWYGAQQGLGILMLTGMRNLDTDLLWGAASLAIALSASAYLVLSVIESLILERFERAAVATSHQSARGYRSGSVTLSFLVVLVGSWWLWVAIGNVPDIVAPSPATVGANLVDNLGSYLGAGWDTLSTALGGLAIGVLLGLLLAVCASASPALAAMVSSMGIIVPTVPIVVLIPMTANIFGYNNLTVLVTAVEMAFFPVFVLVAAGLRARAPGSEDLFRVLSASRGRRLWMLSLPSAVPNLLLSVRLSAASCFIGALTAQWLIGSSGLGYAFENARSQLDIEGSWAIIVVAVVLSVGTYAVCSRVTERASERWM